MKRNALFAMVAAVVLVCSMTNSSARAAKLQPGDSKIIDFMFQVLEHSTPANMPIESRTTVAVFAAAAQAQAMGIQLDQSALASIAARPQAFFVASDTAFVWSGVSWGLVQHGTYTYVGNKVSTYLTQLWAGSWLNNELMTWSYNGNGTAASTLFQSWDLDSSAWANSARSVMTYDGSNRLSTMESQSWDGSAFTPVMLLLYTYDGSNRVETVTTQEWTGAWTNVSRITYTYNGAGYESQSVTDNWFAGNWLTATRWTSTYDGSNRLTLRVREFYNTMWNNDAKSEYEYNGSGDNTLQRDYLWLSNAWSVTDVDTMKYDGSHRLTQTVYNNILPFASVSRNRQCIRRLWKLDRGNRRLTTWRLDQYRTIRLRLHIIGRETCRCAVADEFLAHAESPQPF